MLNPDQRGARAGTNERQPDVRDIIDYADRIGELARLDGADWDLEIGVLAEIFAHSNPGRAPAVLFDNIKGYRARNAHCLGAAQHLPAALLRIRLPGDGRPDRGGEGLSRPHERQFPVDPAGDGASGADPGEHRPR